MPKVSATPSSHEARVIVVCGPTAVGKTRLAVSLARHLGGEIVNADSRQMYQGMNIISGKDIEPGSTAMLRSTISLKGKKFSLVTYEIKSVPVWLYDVAPIGEPLSVSHFQALATRVIRDITARGKVPIIVGGTGFYLSSLFRQIDSLHIPQNTGLREALRHSSTEELQEKLSTTDPERWRRMNISDRCNPRRLIRALEVAVWNDTHIPRAYDSLQLMPFWVGLRVDNNALSVSIRDRVKSRISGGAPEEAKGLGGVPENLPAASTIGLSILRRLLAGEITRDEAITLWTREEIQYAKRQMIWFMGQPDIHWYNAEKVAIDKQVVDEVRQWYT